MPRIPFNSYDYVKSGTYKVKFETVKEELVFSSKRQELFDNLKRFLQLFHCEEDLVESIFIVGSFASKKKQPSDLDIAVKLNESTISTDTHSSELFDENSIKKKYDIQLLFIELEQKSIAEQVPISDFVSKRLSGFRNLKMEERMQISIEERNPNFELGNDAKGIIEVDLNNFCV